MPDLFLPSIHSGTSGVPQADPVQTFIAAWMHLLGERAKVMIRSDKLTHCAMQHANYLAHRTPDEERYSMHVGIGHSYPNDRVLDAGYRLPSYYLRGHNNVESCARNPDNPATVCISLAAHDTHYMHMHCLGGFEAHIYYGVGYAGSDYVALTAPAEQ
jgi:hypothetical protein